MPDHLHLVVMAAEGVDVMSFVHHFKLRSGFLCNQLLDSSGPFWQKSYYDHVLRREEDLLDVRTYVRENPVRAGLVDEADAYPYSGSFADDASDAADAREV